MFSLRGSLNRLPPGASGVRVASCAMPAYASNPTSAAAYSFDFRDQSSGPSRADSQESGVSFGRRGSDLYIIEKSRESLY